MCGRYVLTAGVDIIRSRFSAIVQDKLTTTPRYNIAPTQNCPVVVANEETPTIEAFRWGLVPSWADKINTGYSMINLRTENILSKPSWKRLLSSHRCIIPMTSFYEWIETPGEKYPVNIYFKNHDLIPVAGMWDRWKSPEGEVIHSFTLVTTEANEFMTQVHDRMPVIFHSREQEKVWLDASITDLKVLSKLMKPAPSEIFELYRVSKLVNSPKNDVPECIRPVDEEPHPHGHLFSKASS